MAERAAPIVIKIGGSVLTDPKAYARVAGWLSARVLGPPVLAVVSAETGVTDRLLREAERIVASPSARARDLLWATGELRSAALLALHLEARGIPACALNVHETGLHDVDGTGGRFAARTASITRALATHGAVVAPGFLGTRGDGTIVSLGRGGSDLSAVTLAAALGASRCELIKDVPGYFTADPADDPHARHIADLDIDRALSLADEGCALVQRAALAAAAEAGLPLVITTIAADSRQTVIHPVKGFRHAICHSNDSRRAAF